MEPALKQVALFGAFAGDSRAADGVVGRDLDRAGLAVVVKGDGGSVCPAGVQIQRFGDGHRRLVGVDHIAFSRGGPAEEDFSVTDEGVGLQGALAAVDVLGIILTGAAVGVEGDGDACTGGEAAEVNAVVVLVAAAVLFVSEGQGVTGRHIQFHQRPVHKAADAVYHGGGVVGEGEFVVIGLGGYLVLEGQMGVCGGGQGQGAGGTFESTGGSHNAVFDRPLQVGCTVLFLCCQRQVCEISVQIRLYGLYRNSCLGSLRCRSLLFFGVRVFLCFRRGRSLFRCECGSVRRGVSVSGSGWLHSAGGRFFCLLCLCDCHCRHSQRNRHDKRQQKGTDPFCHGLFLLLSLKSTTGETRCMPRGQKDGMTKIPSLPAILGRDGCSESSTNRPIFCSEKIRNDMPLFAHGDAARCHGSAPCKSPDLRSEGEEKSLLAYTSSLLTE